MRAVIYVRALAGKSARAQFSALRRLCQERGWTVAAIHVDPSGRPPKPSNGKGRLALLDALLDRRSRIGVVCLWRLGILGRAIDDLLWALHEVHVVRGVHVVAPGDDIDTTGDDALKRVLLALKQVEQGRDR